MLLTKFPLQTILGGLLFCAASTVMAQSADADKRVTATDYERAVEFLRFNTSPFVDRSSVDPQWLPDGRFWYQVDEADTEEYVLIDPTDGSRETAAKRSGLSADISAERTNQRWSRNEVTSPDGSKAAFIRDWNLWVRDTKTGQETQLTIDGQENFGYATDNAGWRKSNSPILLWSPDSRKIATYQQDQRHVSDMYLVETSVGAPTLQAWKYPLPEDEDVIRIHRVIIEVDEPKVIRLQMPPDVRRGTLCDDISCSGAFDDNEWKEDGTQLAFVSSSRDHKIATLRVADAATGAVRTVYEEKVPTQYESGRGAINWRYLFDTEEFIWYSQRSDWGHLYLYDGQTGKMKNQITEGDFVVTQLLRMDVPNRKLYFRANGREAGRHPYYGHFYSINFDGSDLRLLTPENADHSIELAPQGNVFVDTYSTSVQPPVSVLRTLDGELIDTLEVASVERLKEKGWKPPTPITVKSRDGRWDLYGLMYTPTDLDSSRKYPVVNYIYPGPQGGSVRNFRFYASRSDHQALAELGFIVVLIEGTCNPGRSKSFHDECYGYMADNTLEDQMSGIRELADRYGFLDLDRVGVWGHSGGGFAAAAALFRYPDFYKVGISESGNHDNRNYEDDWGERYIGLIKMDQSGGSNYEEQANQIFADNLEGKLLLAHGGLDDNVPPYNTYLVVDALIKANKDFDLILFPNARHGYGQDSYYMMRRRWDYFVRHLMGAEPPEEFLIER